MLMFDEMFGLVSAGGLAREVMPIVQQTNFINRVFVEKERTVDVINKYRVLTEEEFFDAPPKKKFFNVALGSSKAREEISRRFMEQMCTPFTLKAKSAIIYDDVVLGDGALICDYAMLTSNIRIGKFFQANIYSYVAHDCIIGDYVTLAPKVCCNGRVKVGDHVYIGTGAIIKNGTSDKFLTIGEGAVIGAGAVVTKDVLPYTTVVGNPAKIMEKK